MTKGNSRVRWNEDERNTILAAYRTLHAREPRGDTAKLFETALKALPPKRRRKLDYKLRVWLQTEGAQARGRTPASSTVIVPPSKSARSARHQENHSTTGDFHEECTDVGRGFAEGAPSPR